ncbi:SIS domain-containing protein [Planktomarina temperata]|nr:SIS domain-containing protein [Planktomarina temperata]
MSINKIRNAVLDSIAVKKEISEDQNLLNKVMKLSNDCVTCLKNGGKIIFCGNGGSFADAQHLSAEFTSRFMFDRPALASIALGTNNSGITAMANDYGYKNVFSRELDAVGQIGDFLIAMTTSGNSLNILNAVELAQKTGIQSLVLTGSSGGEIAAKADCLHIPSEDTPRIQESHILIGHIVCQLVEQEMFPELARHHLSN